MLEKIKSIDFFKSKEKGLVKKEESGTDENKSVKFHISLSGNVLIGLVIAGVIVIKLFSMHNTVESAAPASVEETVVDAEENLSDEQKLDFYKEISSINPTEIHKTLDFITATENKETDSLVNLYWALDYLAKNDEELRDEDFKTEIKEQILKVKNHYTTRRMEFVKTYNLILHKNYNAITSTYDNEEVLEKLLNWVSFQKLDKIDFLPETTELTTKYAKYMKNPAEVQKYLTDMKEQISKSRDLLTN